jgi:hypothetical protein
MTAVSVLLYARLKLTDSDGWLSPAARTSGLGSFIPLITNPSQSRVGWSWALSRNILVDTLRSCHRRSLDKEFDSIHGRQVQKCSRRRFMRGRG